MLSVKKQKYTCEETKTNMYGMVVLQQSQISLHYGFCHVIFAGRRVLVLIKLICLLYFNAYIPHNCSCLFWVRQWHIYFPRWTCLVLLNYNLYHVFECISQCKRYKTNRIFIKHSFGKKWISKFELTLFTYAILNLLCGRLQLFTQLEHILHGLQVVLYFDEIYGPTRFMKETKKFFSW